MAVISLKEAFDTILDKLEDVDQEKHRRYQAVYRRLRDMEDYALTLGVVLDPPGLPALRPGAPYLPEGLDIVALMAGRQRPDAAALANGAQVARAPRLLATAHSIGVMERLRDLPSLRRLLEEVPHFQGLARAAHLHGHRGRLRAGLLRGPAGPGPGVLPGACWATRTTTSATRPRCRMADLLALGEMEWRKDLPKGAVVVDHAWVLPQLARVLDLLDLAPEEATEDMSPQEQIIYSVPIFLRRFFSRANPKLAAEAMAMVVPRLRARAGDRRPLSALYTCESFELLAGSMDPTGRASLPAVLQGWVPRMPNVRLMAWRVLRLLAGHGQQEPGLLAEVGRCVDALGPFPRRQASVAELYLLEHCARLTGRTHLADRCRDQREQDRTPIREVMLRNLKTQTGWVEKKVNCDYLLELVSARPEGDPLAGEVGFHLANLLKVSRVEGTRFNAGRCLLKLIPALTDTQRNDMAIELVRSLQLDGEGVTRYLPRFLGPLLASLPAQELVELVTDMEQDSRRGTEGLQRLLVQAATWLIIALPGTQAPASVSQDCLRRLACILLGSLADSRTAVAHEGYAHLALLLDWLRPDPRLGELLRLTAKKVLTLLQHIPGDSGRFFLAAQVLSSLDKAMSVAKASFPKAPSIGFLPGTFDPFTAAHGEMVRRALAHCDEVFVQVDDFSWRKHAQPRFLRADLAWMALSTIPHAYLFPFEPPGEHRQRRQPPAAAEAPGTAPGAPHRRHRRAGRRLRLPEPRLAHLEHPPPAHHPGGASFPAVGEQARAVPERRAGVPGARPHEERLQHLPARGPGPARASWSCSATPWSPGSCGSAGSTSTTRPARRRCSCPSGALRLNREGRGLPAGLEPLVQLDATRAVSRWTGRKPRTAVLQSRETGEDLAALTWLEGTATALPVALEDESLAGGGRRPAAGDRSPGGGGRRLPDGRVPGPPGPAAVPDHRAVVQRGPPVLPVRRARDGRASGCGRCSAPRRRLAGRTRPACPGACAGPGSSSPIPW